jgi:hypothetical protein
MTIQTGKDRIGAQASGSIAPLGPDRRVASTRNRSICGKTQRTPVTLNTMVVLVAIVALIAILNLLESRIRRLSVHSASQYSRAPIVSGRTAALNKDQVGG